MRRESCARVRRFAKIYSARLRSTFRTLIFHLFCCVLCVGSISIDELRGVMKSLGQSPTEEELTRMIQSVDDNGNNEIDFQEFLILMSSKKSVSDDPDRELKDAFAVFDTDGSGLISRSELKGLLNNLGQLVSDEELDAMMGEVDKDGNGEIDFEEFKAMMVRVYIPLYLYGMEAVSSHI